MHKTKSKRYTQYPWKWPFLDMLLVREKNKTHLRQNIRKSNIWPTRRLQLGPITMTAPGNVEEWLQKSYGMSWSTRCQTRKNSHKFEKNMNSLLGHGAVTVPCEDLYPYYPFMRRINGTERLMVGNTTYYHNKP